MLLMFLARLPMTAMGVTMTLYVVDDLGRGYGAAGLVGAATTLGSAIGAPLVGRYIDRYGLRPVVAICGLASSAFWISAPYLPYQALLAVALPAGVLSVPAGTLARLVLTALVPLEQRRAAYSLDTILVEASFMIGPAAGIMAITQLPAVYALTGIGICFVISATLIYRQNPPIRAEADTEVHTGERPTVRSWLTGRLVMAMFIAAGALFCLIGMELAALATLRASGDIGWSGLLITLMCVASVLGGAIHGAVRRSLSQGTLMLLLAVLTLPVGLITEPWWLLAIVLFPSNVLCAPTLAASTETVSAAAPPRVRGEAMGLLDAASRIGLAIGSPIIGFVIDRSGPGWGFAAAALGALAIASVGLFWRRSRTPARVPALTSS
ncbi:MFS transporter [Amycolatopsis sp. QT-25]|uniref:MFS transporter n=1 Tax=Amycolatopsis sp. QT-25 TaxID=3034022 RepID=UPI0023EB05B3|nr:MFS transporter [Amycolatopsis sp. QT-25]WET79214.1 MFS transporter [Amycolatopsis sp. QT-25]